MSTVRSIAAAADRFGGRPSALGRMPPTGGVGVRARFLEEELPCCGFSDLRSRRSQGRRRGGQSRDARRRVSIDWEASGEELDGG